MFALQVHPLRLPHIYFYLNYHLFPVPFHFYCLYERGKFLSENIQVAAWPLSDASILYTCIKLTVSLG